MLKSVAVAIKRKLGMDYKSKCIKEVLVAFKVMGADRDELKKEKQKLAKDEMYLAEWSVAVNPKREIGR